MATPEDSTPRIYPAELDEASGILDQALGVIDMVFTLHHNDLLDSLCGETLESSLCGLITTLSQAKRIIDNYRPS